MGKKVTIQDIANALGISRNTVSKAINNSDGLAEETREKILQKAVEMGYKQFSYVRALYQEALSEASEKTAPVRFGEIALLTTSRLGGSHFAIPMLDRIQSELNQLGYRLNTHYVDPIDISAQSLPFTFDPKQVSAILCIELFDWDYDKMLCDLGLPILFVDGPACTGGRALPADQLYMDNYSGIAQLITGLVRDGVRRVGFLGNFLHCQSFFERYVAFRSAMMQMDLPVEDRHIISTDDPLALYQRLSSLEELPDLFICANDSIALDVLQIFRRLGKSVPKDVMLCGFDDIPESRRILPTLTTVHIHSQFMAFTAVSLLITRIKEPSLNFRRVYTETELILRESTGTEFEEAPL